MYNNIYKMKNRELFSKTLIKKIAITVILAILLIFSLLAAYKYAQVNETVEALSKYGSSGSEVTKIQTKLKRWGYYSGSIDGIYGSKNCKGCKVFSKKKWAYTRWNSRWCNFKSNGNYIIKFKA